VVGPVWIATAGAFPSRHKAEERASELRDEGYEADVLWIPDYGSFSGAEYWLAYVGYVEYSDRDGAEQMLADVRREVSDSYVLKLDDTGPREEIR